MMHNKQLTIRVMAVLSLILMALAPAAFAKAPNVALDDIRNLGMGGPGVASAKGFNTLYYNPALLAGSDFSLELVNLTVYSSKDIQDLIEFIDDNQDAFDNFADTTLDVQQQLLDDMAPFDNNWMGVGAFPQLGLTFSNYAVGAYGAADVEYKVDKGIFEPRVVVRGRVDQVYTAGLAFDAPTIIQNLLPNTLHMGVAAKIIKRWDEKLNLEASEADDLGDTFDTLKENSETGYGIDVGFLYDFSDRIRIGATAQDVLGKVGGEDFPMVINAGMAMNVTERLTFAADYRDFFFTQSSNIFNKVYFGAEFDMPLLDFRAGFSQGYPSGGLGINLGIVQFDAAVYSKELTGSPGNDGDYRYAARFKIGW